jgi:hypothetical protein
MRPLTRLLILLAIAAIPAFGQGCGKLTLNPITGLLDCTGSGGSGTPNQGVAFLSGATSCDITGLSIPSASFTSGMFQAWIGSQATGYTQQTAKFTPDQSSGTVTSVTGSFGGAAAGNGYCVASSGSGPAGPQGPAGTVPNMVTGLVYASTGAAAANTTLLQTALTAKGHVIVDCPAGSVIYISTTLTIYSQTKLDIYPGCTLRAIASTGAVMANYAATSAWTTLWNSSGSVTTGPQAVIWENSAAAWSANSGSGTAYAKGTYVNANSNIYWESVSTCTGATTGSGPTGTGSAITDGTCSWNYVTTYTAPGTLNNVTLLAVVNWPSHGLSLGASVWLTPQPDNPSVSQNYWSGTQSAGQQGGVADSAYFGIFQVVAVNDTNNVTVVLRRAPSVAFSGIPMNIKTADQNIEIGGGGTLDYNYPTNAGAPPVNIHDLVLAGVSGVKINQLFAVNASKYGLLLSAENADIGGFSFGPAGSNSDRIKCYGPCFDVNVHNSYGRGGDDVLSLQTEESSFNTYILACGDVLNVRGEFLTSDGGVNIIIYPSNPYLLVDEIELSHSAVNNVGTQFAINESSPVGTVGSVHVHDLSARFSNNNPIVSVFQTGSGTIQNINIHDIDVGPAFAGGLYVQNAPSTTVGSVVASRIGGTFSGLLLYNYAGTVSQMILEDSYLTCGGSYTATLVTDGTQGTPAPISYLTLRNSTVLGNCAYAVTNYATGANIVFDGMVMPATRCGVSAFVSSSISVRNTNLVAASFGLARFQVVSKSETVTSGGGNNVYAGGAWFTFPNAGTVTPYGFDIQCDVTKMNRVSGAFCFNTNAAPGSGTLTTAGLVANQGTGSNSWFLLANPTGQVY